MDLLSQYSDPDSLEDQPDTSSSSVTTSLLPINQFSLKVNSAPSVKDPEKLVLYKDPYQRHISDNPRYESLWTPVQGPVDPNASQDPLGFHKNMLTGYVEDFEMNHYSFDEQYHNFHSYGWAHDPTTGVPLRVLSDKHPTTAKEQGPDQTELEKFSEEKGSVYDKKKKAPTARKRLRAGDPATDTYLGPWAPYADEPVVTDADKALREKIEKEVEEKERQEKEKEKEKEKKRKKESEETSIFHGKQERDYQGRTYLYPPSDLKPIGADVERYIPKKQIHIWTGHTRGVSQIRFFPTTGHLLLSSSLDSTIKIWDVYNQRQCLRTYMGHLEGVRDVNFNHDGTKFISASLDRYIKLWDTETGQCIQRMTNRKVPYCCKFYPKDENQFLAGCSDKKIIQWDARSGQITQEYDQHLGAVNTITFIDEARRFVSSSDDKSIRVWEYGIPVVIKYISEPHMHSMPSIAVHPNKKWFVGQSLDNQILVYSTRDRFKLNKKKRFLGHLVAGYACEVNFSPDGRFIMSGDCDGKIWFWDWKSMRVYRTIRAHKGVSIGCAWHPIELSRMATCGWDGTIKYWD